MSTEGFPGVRDQEAAFGRTESWPVDKAIAEKSDATPKPKTSADIIDFDAHKRFMRGM